MLEITDKYGYDGLIRLIKNQIGDTLSAKRILTTDEAKILIDLTVAHATLVNSYGKIYDIARYHKDAFDVTNDELASVIDNS